MSSVLRAASVVAVAAVTGTALYIWCFVPFRCNITEKYVQDATIRAAADTDRLRAARVARYNIDRLQSCLNSCPTVNRLMLAAANERILNRDEAAVTLYEMATKYDRRPELYFNLGLCQTQIGQVRAGIDNLVTACIYNPWLIDEISTHHGEVARRIALYKSHMEQLAKAKR